MKGIAIGFGLAGVLLLGGAVLLASWAGLPGGLGVLGLLFMDADPIVKLVMMLLGPTCLAVLVMGAVELVRNPPRGPSDGLGVLAYTAAGAGLLAALYGSINIYLAVMATGTRNLKVVAPSVSEMMLAAGLGLLVGAVAAALNAAAASRAGRA